MFLNNQKKQFNPILAQLDNCANDFTFPILDNGYVYPADVRMSVYANPKDWAILIEVIGYSNRSWKTEAFENCLYCFGTNLKNPPGLSNDNLFFPVTDGITAPLFRDEDYDTINPNARDIRIRDNLITIPTDPVIYQKNGIILAQATSIYGFELLRLLTINYRKLFLATETELYARMEKEIPLILQLHEWYHPDIIEGEKPSDVETFIQIADVITQLDKSYYRPSNPPNSHWKNWPMGGTL